MQVCNMQYAGVSPCSFLHRSKPPLFLPLPLQCALQLSKPSSLLLPSVHHTRVEEDVGHEPHPTSKLFLLSVQTFANVLKTRSPAHEVGGMLRIGMAISCTMKWEEGRMLKT
jgi:hypothetical protein